MTKDYDGFAEQLTIYDDPSLLEDDAYTDNFEEYIETTGEEIPVSVAEKTPEEPIKLPDEKEQPAVEKQDVAGPKDMENMTVEELDVEIERMKKLLELAELHKKVKKNE